MNKKLFTQIRNEWRTNLWLGIELLLVSIVMWYITDYLYVRLSVYREPKGFDVEHCYLITMGHLTDKSPNYVERTSKEKNEDILELVNRLRQRPEVEAVSLSQNSYPYNNSNSGAALYLAGDTLVAMNRVVARLVTPDFVRVFRYQGANGETPEQLAEILERDEILASDNLFTTTYNRPLPMTAYVGRQVHFGDSTNTDRLGASYQVVRYSDFQEAGDSRSVMFKRTVWDEDKELCVRVRSDLDKDFIARLKADSEKHYRIGNIFISDVRSFADIRKRFQQGAYNDLRNFFTVMAFLLLNIFLGLLGTFWFRTQQRRSEIALHKAHGATNRMVFVRLLSEGWLLLLVVTPLALFVDFLLAHAELNSWLNGVTLETGRFLCCVSICFLLIATMITIGIGIPAKKAMGVDPAEALHDE